MNLLTNKRLIELLKSEEENSLFVDPILNMNQVGNVTLDLRLGYDFQVSVLTRKSFIDIANSDSKFKRGINTYFQITRRDIGDKFLLYPHQTVVATTLEYISLPPNVYADLLSRSSYTRLGLHVNTMLQAGFRGCASLELFNHNNNAIELVVGSRLCQARFFEIDDSDGYLCENSSRKYYGDVRPMVSKADRDEEIARLVEISKNKNRPLNAD